MNIRIERFDHAGASPQAYAAMNVCRNIIRAEELPDDPPIPVEEMTISFQNIPSSVILAVWAARQGDRVIGYALAQLPLEDNLKMAQFNIAVLPEFRRQGLGKRLLREVIHLCSENERVSLIFTTQERNPAGALFGERLGAVKGLEAHTNQLVIANVDPDMISEWIKRCSEKARAFELGWWFGPYPAEDMSAILELHDLFNQQPFGDLEVEDFRFTEEMIRQQEHSIFARGYERWTVYAREIETGQFAGYSEVLWNPNRPDVILQEITGVFPKYRNNGLGRWLKAAMIEKIQADRPQAKHIRTGNADSNVPMLKINTELGFKPYQAESVWQVKRETVEKYLEQSLSN